MKKIIPLAVFGLLANTLVAQKYSNEFLNIGIGARAQGMGNVQIAAVKDITAAYWNPAALANIETPWQAGAMHAEWFAGVAQYDYLSFGKQINPEQGSFLAFSLIRLGIDNIPYTINLLNNDGTVNYDNLSTFSAADYAGLFSYGRKLKNPALSVGATLKLVRRVIGKIGNSWGFGADMGLRYELGDWVFGIQGRDLTTTFNAWSFKLTEKEKEVFTATDNEIPAAGLEITRPALLPGAARRFIFNEKTTLLAAVDLEFSTDGRRNVLLNSKTFNMDPRMGFELDYVQRFQVRTGLGNFQRVKKDFNPNETRLTFQPNFGLGVRLGRLQLDYALTDIGNVSQVLYSHIFSLILK